MADHGARAHATWSASASDRRWACAGSLAMEMDAPADRESFAAAWGTACHQVADKCLRGGGDALDYLGTTEATKEHQIPVDEEVCETAQEFIDYVRDRGSHYSIETGDTATLLVEQKFSLAPIKPPFDAGGTGDAVLLFPKWGLVEIVDLKGGRGIVVEALGNKQLRTYALGALLANPGRWEAVQSTIVQPRAPHPDGRIRSETIDVAELMDWASDLKDAMDDAADAVNCRGADSTWDERFLAAGDHCTFCKAKVGCPALQSKALEAAHTHFSPEGGMTTPPPPESLGMDQVVRILDAADMIQNWLNAVRGYAQEQAELGRDVTDGTHSYVLTPKQARRKWKDEDGLAAELAKRAGLEAADFYGEPKLLTPAQAEKVIGKTEAKAVLDGLVEKTSSGFNLTRSDKTTRAAVLAPPLQMFQVEKD